MPYINQVARDILEPKIDALAQLLKSYSDDEIEGVMNYTITELINRGMKRDEWRYKWINRLMGVLECVKFEFYRRLVSPYEDEAIKKSGDIQAYKIDKETKPKRTSASQLHGLMAETIEWEV